MPRRRHNKSKHALEAIKTLKVDLSKLMGSPKTVETKKLFLEVYTNKLGFIGETCKAVDMSRQCYLNWRREDKIFEQACLELEEYLVDFSEHKLLDRINHDDITAIIFHLKTKGKSRGYVERTEQEHSGEIVITHRIPVAKEPPIEKVDYGVDNKMIGGGADARTS